jgi:DNA polymerase-3 subunit beta
VLAFGDANSSALVTMPERNDYKYVVMPMRI